MAFTNKPFIWKNNGVTPPETLQNSGFIGGKKLPAPYVNAQWTATYKAIEELQQKAGEVKTINNIQPDSDGNVLIPLPDVSKFYQKPTSGIPKTDLSSDVQTSLTKAESALQSVPLATAALDGLMSKGDKVSLDSVTSVFANLQKMKITNDDGSAIYTIGATLPTVKKGIFHAVAGSGTYAPPVSSVEGIIIAESASYWNFIGASDNGTWCVGTFQSTWKGWTTLATAKDVSNLSTRITALETSDTTHQADLVSHGIYGVATGTNALVMTDSKVTSYVDGMLVAFKNTTASTSVTTLNINNLGAKAIVKANGTAVNNLKANAIYQLRYNGINFILLGEGGEYGNVTAADVRSTKTFGTEDGVVQGTLDLSNLTTENIQWGTTVGGVTGELTGKKLIRPLKPDSELSYEDNSNAELKTTYYTDAKKVTVNHSGMIRIAYNLFLSGNGNTAYAGIFKNGIQMKEISNTVNYVEVKSVVDISVVTGDVITLRLKVVNTSGGSFNNLFQIGVTTVQIGPNVVTKGVV